MLSDPPTWLGGYSLNVSRNPPTMLTPGTIVQSLSPHQRAIHHRLVLIALPRILPQVGHERNVGGFLGAGKQIALDGLEAEFPVLVSQGREVAIVGEVEEFLARSLGDVAFQERHEVVTVEMGLEGFVADLQTAQKLCRDVGIAGGGQEGRQEILARGDVVDDAAGLDRAGPPHDHRHAEPAFEGRALLAAERRVAAVGPGKGLGAVIAGENDDGVVGNAEVVDLLENGADFRVQFHHGIGIEAIAALVLPLG